MMQEMARRWLEIENRLQYQIDALAYEIAHRREIGEAVTQSQIWRMQRYKSLVQQAREQTRLYEAFADDLIVKRQQDLLLQGIENAQEAMRASYLGAGQVVSAFEVLPVSAVEAAMGLAADGSPLKEYLRQTFPDAIEGLTQELIQGVAAGKHPVKIARAMRRGFGMGINQSLNTARTETLRAYRLARRLQYEKSGLVEAYKRLSARDTRVGLGCLLKDGEVYPVARAFDEHNQGRCDLVPVMVDLPAPVWTSGSEWLKQQPRETQVSIMGKGHYRAWQQGAALEAMVTYKFDETWGGAFVPTPLKQINS
jgi:hypothetical protein